MLGTLDLVYEKWEFAINAGHHANAANALAAVYYQSIGLYRFAVIHQSVKRREEMKEILLKNINSE